MSDDLAALLRALAIENAKLSRELATAQDMLMETAIDAGHLHARIEAMRTEHDAQRKEAGRQRHDQPRRNLRGVVANYPAGRIRGAPSVLRQAIAGLALAG